MKHLFFIILCFACTAQFAQSTDQITLKECLQQSEEHYPLAVQSGVVDQITDEAIQKVNAFWQPQVAFNAQATYQSEVVGLPIESPFFEMPELSKDQYKATLDITQMLYDGGLSHQQKTLQTLNGEIEKQKVSVELYKVKERVAQLYFSLLLAGENNKLLDQVLEDMMMKKKAMTDGLANGVVTQSSIDVLEAEILNIHQKQIEIAASVRSGKLMLAQLTGIRVNESTILQIPELEATTGVTENSRPELTLYSLQTQYAVQQHEFSAALTLPKVSLFAQGGYGRPGLNYLLDEFDFYYLTGVKVNYPLWQGNAKKHDGAIYFLTTQSIAHQQEVFQLNTTIRTTQQQSEIDQYNELLKTDQQIIQLRTKIKNTAAVQLENGVITATDYVSEVNEELRAKQNLSIHEMQRLTAKANYLITLGKL